MLYGLVKAGHAQDFAKAVCDVLGNGDNNVADKLMVETAAAETLLGQYRDPTERAAGTGLTQVDLSTFEWLKDKFKTGKEADAIKKAFNISIGKVEYLELETSPLLAFIFCRLRYRVVPEQIPATLEGRAKYWKEHYNSTEGKGTPQEYIKRVKDCGLPTT